MPCGNCGNAGHNSRSCTEKKKIPAPAPAAAKPTATPAPAKVANLRTAAAPTRVAGEDLDELTIEDLVDRRDAYDAAIDRRVATVEEELAALKAAQAKARARAEALG